MWEHLGFRERGESYKGVEGGGGGGVELEKGGVCPPLPTMPISMPIYHYCYRYHFLHDSLILDQCSTSATPENVRKPKVF